MFGTNEPATKKDYAGLEPNQLKITTIFQTLQGEGPLAGMPCVFVRLTGCHRRCDFCDTHFTKGDVMSFDDILKAAHQVIPQCWSKKLLVITGGEPMLQKNLGPFLQFAHAMGFCAQIESAGDMLVPGIPQSTMLVVSPKVNEVSGKYQDLGDEVWERADAIKVLVHARPDHPYNQLPFWLTKWADQRSRTAVFISPLNCYTRPPNQEAESFADRVRNETVSFWEPGLLDMAQNRANHEYAAFLCRSHGYRLSIQSHLLASIP